MNLRIARLLLCITVAGFVCRVGPPQPTAGRHCGSPWALMASTKCGGFVGRGAWEVGRPVQPRLLMKVSTVLLAGGLVLAFVPVAVVGATATGLTVMSAAMVPAACTPASDGGAPCSDGADPIDGGAAYVPLPNAASGLGAAAALEAVAAVGRGGRYVVEGNGPVDFDCSGLTAWAWRQAGVSLPDYSYSQWDATARIAREQLAPGDLVFWFGGDVHHVAIVVAVDGGRVVIAEAANPDAGLRIRDLGGSWDAAYLSGYGRVART